MAKKQRLRELTTLAPPVGGLAPIEKRGPIVPVRRGKRTRHLQDGRWLPGWLVWLRRKRVALALLALGVVGYGAVRLLLAGRR